MPPSPRDLKLSAVSLSWDHGEQFRVTNKRADRCIGPPPSHLRHHHHHRLPSPSPPLPPSALDSSGGCVTQPRGAPRAASHASPGLEGPGLCLLPLGWEEGHILSLRTAVTRVTHGGWGCWWRPPFMEGWRCGHLCVPTEPLPGKKPASALEEGSASSFRPGARPQPTAHPWVPAAHRKTEPEPEPRQGMWGRCFPFSCFVFFFFPPSFLPGQLSPSPPPSIPFLGTPQGTVSRTALLRVPGRTSPEFIEPLRGSLGAEQRQRQLP